MSLEDVAIGVETVKAGSGRAGSVALPDAGTIAQSSRWRIT
jgi:hypothetical protein